MSDRNERLAVVFGANGSIGKTLLAELSSRDIPSRAIVRPEKIHEVVDLATYTVEADLDDRDSLGSALQGGSEIYYTPAVFHQGRARGRLARKISNGRAFCEASKINIDLPLEIHAEAENQHIPTLIYISSIAVYGDQNGEINEEAALKAKGIYGLTKKIAEDKLLDAQNNTSVSIVRPANVLGPGAEIWTQTFYDIFSNNGRFILDLDAGKLPFVDIRDVAKAMILAAGNANAEGQVYNLASDDNPAISEIVRYYEDLLGYPVRKTNPHLAIGLGYIFDAYSYITGKPAKYTSESVKNLADTTRVIANEKAKRDLHMDFRSLNETMTDSISWLQSSGIIFDTTAKK